MIAFFKFPLVDTLGGAEFHTLKLAKRFQSAGKEIKLFTSDKKLFGLFRDHNLPAEYMFAGWEPTSKWSLLLWPLTFFIARSRLKRLIKEIPPQSVLFMQSLIEKLILTPLLLSTPSSPARHASPARQVVVSGGRVEAGGSPPYQGGEREGIWLEHKIPGRWLKMNPLRHEYLRFARQVQLVTVSNFAKREFIKLGVPENNVKVIYPGVRTPPRSPSLIKEGEGGSSFTIGILSRLDPEKGVLDFLKLIIPHLPDRPNWKILIAGEGKEEQKIINIIRKHNLYDQIRLLGFIHNLDNFFFQISVLAYPTKAPESFGIGVLEAQSRGVPVIASNLGALPEIIEHGENGFLIDSPPPNLPHQGGGTNKDNSLLSMGRAREGWAEYLEQDRKRSCRERG